MIVVLLVIDPVLALVALATAPLLAALSYVYRRRVRAQARVRRAPGGPDRVDRRRGAVGDGGRQGVRLRALRGRPRARAAASSGWPPASRSRGCRRASTGSSASVRAVGTALVLVVGVLRVAHGAICPGELIVFVSYTRKAHSPMRSSPARRRRSPRRWRGPSGSPSCSPPTRCSRSARGAYRGGRARRRRRARATCRSPTRAGRPALRRRLAARRRRRARRADGPVGRRQVDARRADRALLRPDRRAAC